MLDATPDRQKVLPLQSLLLTETCADDDGLSALAPFIPNLRRLDVYQVRLFLWNFHAASCSRLPHHQVNPCFRFSLSNQCWNLHDAGLCAIFDHCPRLHMLVIGGGPRVTDAALLHLARSSCRSVFEQFQACAELNESTSELDYRTLQPASMYGSSAGRQQLRAVLGELHDSYGGECDLCAAEMADGHMECIYSQPGVECPESSPLRITDVGIEALAAACPRLRAIDVSGMAHFTDRSLHALARASCATTLSHVSLDFCPRIGTDAVASLVRRCGQLRFLSVFGCPNVDALVLIPVYEECGQRLMMAKADTPTAINGSGGMYWPKKAWNAHWSSRQMKHLALSGRRSFGWDLAEEADEDRKNM